MNRTLLLGLVAVPFGGLSCAPRGEPTSAPSARIASPEKRGDVTTDFKELGRWCENAYDQVGDAKGANPITGEEFEKSKLTELKALLVGKTVTWQIEVFRINPPQTVSLSSIHIKTFKKPDYIQTIAAVRFNRRADLNEIDSVPDDLMRRLKLGEPATVTGKVKDLTSKYEVGYLIDVEDAKLSLP